MVFTSTLSYRWSIRPNLDPHFSFFVAEKTNSEKKTKTGETRARRSTRTRGNNVMTTADRQQIFKTNISKSIYDINVRVLIFNRGSFISQWLF